MIHAAKDLHSRWLGYIDTLPWVPGHLDHSSWNAFLRAGSLGIPFEYALGLVERRILACGGNLREVKVQSQLRRAYQLAAGDAKISLAERRTNWTGPKPNKPTFDPARTEAFARQITPISEDWLIEHSPIDVRPLRPDQFLEISMRQANESFNRYRSQGQRIWQHA